VAYIVTVIYESLPAMTLVFLVMDLIYA